MQELSDLVIYRIRLREKKKCATNRKCPPFICCCIGMVAAPILQSASELMAWWLSVGPGKTRDNAVFVVDDKDKLAFTLFRPKCLEDALFKYKQLDEGKQPSPNYLQSSASNSLSTLAIVGNCPGVVGLLALLGLIGLMLCCRVWKKKRNEEKEEPGPKKPTKTTQPVPSKYTEKGNLRAHPPNSETLKKIAADRKDHEEHPEWKSMYRVIHGRDGRGICIGQDSRRTSTFLRRFEPKKEKHHKFFRTPIILKYLALKLCQYVIGGFIQLSWKLTHELFEVIVSNCPNLRHFAFHLLEENQVNGDKLALLASLRIVLCPHSLWCQQSISTPMKHFSSKMYVKHLTNAVISPIFTVVAEMMSNRQKSSTK
uniref:Uncharacterized protein n=1 Tax=Ditylenchus dipsaci TaxID=166011 RepID=A0A915DWH1_9BILA